MSLYIKYRTYIVHDLRIDILYRKIPYDPPISFSW